MIGSVTLFDHADGTGAALYDKSGLIGRAIDELRHIDAAELTTRFRGNKATQLKFSIARPVASEVDLLVALFGHEATIPENQALLFISTDGTQVVAIPGNLQTVGMRHVGTRVFFDYAFLGGRPLVIDPTGIMLNEDGSWMLNENGVPVRVE